MTGQRLPCGRAWRRCGRRVTRGWLSWRATHPRRCAVGSALAAGWRPREARRPAAGVRVPIRGAFAACRLSSHGGAAYAAARRPCRLDGGLRMKLVGSWSAEGSPGLAGSSCRDPVAGVAIYSSEAVTEACAAVEDQVVRLIWARRMACCRLVRCAPVGPGSVVSRETPSGQRSRRSGGGNVRPSDGGGAMRDRPGGRVTGRERADDARR